MQLDFGENTKFHVRISLHIDDFVGNFPKNLGKKDTVVTPAANTCLKLGKINVWVARCKKSSILL